MSYFDILIDFIHLAGVVTWLGGVIFINHVFYKVIDVLPPDQKGKAMGVMTKHFGRIAWFAIAMLVISGFFNFPDDFNNSNSTYNTALNVKVVVILMMISLAALVSFKLGPETVSLAANINTEEDKVKLSSNQIKIKKIGLINMILGFIVLFLASVLLNAH
ncbi:MAG: CopD family protein [Candidatus Heimdallarchaeota archaeon]|nr:CopD family protein [Candidatus Heimdallarchaeota archaeon]MDH5645558.1 CopD family protein [Candidatus Heimdallarchaeota archaeon]